MSERAQTNIARAGEFFMYCLWLQGQMADLIILRKHPDLRQPFVASPKKVPTEMGKRRAEYWEKDFSVVRKDFEALFRNQMSKKQLADLNAIYLLRNAIAHCHVSIARDYLLFRPGRGEKQELEMINALKLQPVADQANPRMMTLRLYDDERYLNDFNRIKRLDEECFSKIAVDMGIPHGRIR